MIIVSQDKCAIVNLDNIKTIELDRETDFKSIIIFRETNEVETGVCGLFIGHYATRERAKEVLQEIIKSYRYYRTAECDGYTNVLQETAVFEMPED
uniref:Uncharacterized protein n=1 Tax=Myoviridae sp. ctCL221 TaxID=2826630 RepID=A0A8S5M6D7_9CAUD|nr:MAG TPA: hypothetical protein [Myoviridae sp. ctCL221]